MDREQRAHARKRLSTAITFNIAGGESQRGWLRDISRGGCFVATPSVLKVGEVVDVVLRLPGIIKLIVGKARVQWVRDKAVRDLPAGMGLQFTEIAEDSLVAIDSLSATSPALKKSRTFIGVAPPPPTSSPSFSPEVVPQEVLDALKAEAASAARAENDEKTAKVKMPVAQLEAEAIAAEAAQVTDEVPAAQVPEEEPPAEFLSPLGPAAASAEEPPQPPHPPPLPSEPIDLPDHDGGDKKRKKWLLAAGLGALGTAGILAIVIAFTHKGGGAADAAAEAQADVAAEAASVVDATVVVVVPDVSAPSVDAQVEDATIVDARADAPHDGGRDGGKDGGHRDAGHDAGHGHKKPKH